MIWPWVNIKWVVNPPQNGTIGFDLQPYILRGVCFRVGSHSEGNQKDITIYIYTYIYIYIYIFVWGGSIKQNTLSITIYLFILLGGAVHEKEHTDRVPHSETNTSSESA